jgi:hypothetical protein
MWEIDIPGFGPVVLEHLVSDFTGTLIFRKRNISEGSAWNML